MRHTAKTKIRKYRQAALALTRTAAQIEQDIRAEAKTKKRRIPVERITAETAPIKGLRDVYDKRIERLTRHAVSA
jgi:hypothetical protein